MKNIIIILILIFSLNLVNAATDSNGVWHLAADIRPGTFGSDEIAGTWFFTSEVSFQDPTSFQDDVYFNKKLIFNNIYSIDMSGTTKLNDIRSNTSSSNQGTITGNLKIITSSGRGVKSDSTDGDAIFGHLISSTGAAISGWAEGGSFSGYFEEGDLVVMGGGKVGIGVFDPQVSLDVIGDIHMNGELVATKTWVNNNFTSTPSLDFVLDNGNDAGNLQIKNIADATIDNDVPSWGQVKAHVLNNGSGLWSENGNKIFYNNGNVGIGTNNPTVKLDVQGTTRLNGNG